jgi:type I restriction enzyme S subunit
MASDGLPDGWRLVKLGDLGEVNRGRSRHRPRYAEHLYGGPYPFIQTGDIKNSGGRITSYQQTYSEAGLAQSRMWPANTMCITIAANIAETAILAFPACFPDSVVGFIAEDSKCEIRFVEYTFRFLRQQLQREASGSVQDNINLETLDRLRFPLPPLPEQRAIAHILGTLDDKIELNRRMSETLEAMARALFKSWFVDFDPVRAKAEGRDPGLPQPLADLFPARLVDSELGEIPEGWAMKPVGEHIVNFDSKRVPVSGADRAERKGPYPYHGAAGVMDYVDDYLFDGVHLLVGEDGSVVQDTGMAVTQYVWGKIWVNNHAHVLQGKGAVSTEQLYLYFHFEPVVPYVTGAVQPKLSQGRMNAMPFVFAGEAVCRAFGRTIHPLFAKVRAAVDETRTVAALRDSLLPKLISGELRVKDAEKYIGRAV